MGKSGFENILPRKYFEENFHAVDLSDEALLVMQELEKFLSTKEGSTLAKDYRGKIFNFVETNGYIAEGRSNSTPQGNYLLGTPPKYNTDTRARAHRTCGEQMYVKSLVSAFNKYVNDKSFKFNKDNNYTTRTDALLAAEASYISSKGPYDNAVSDTAIKTVNHVLENHKFSDYLPDDCIPALNDQLSRRFTEYKRVTNRKFAANAHTYVLHMQSRGLSSTMRGFPFFASGNSEMQQKWIPLITWMFKDTPIPITTFEWKSCVEVKNEDGSVIKRNKTIDEYIQDVLSYIQDNNVKSEDWITLRQLIILPISRNQGSPYKTKIEKNQVVLTGERKDMKYRLVTPIAAFVQAMSIIGTIDAVLNVKSTEGRVGLEDPTTNVNKMNQFIRKAWELLQIIISTDFDAYDSTLNSQLMSADVNMLTYLYHDEFTKQCLICAAISLCHKIMLLPCQTTDKGTVYSDYTRHFFKNIKGIKSFSNKRINDSKLFSSDTFSELVTERFDYAVWGFYIHKGYLPSGHILTNTVGSDCTLHMGRGLIPYLLHYPAQEAQASGDDCIQYLPKALYDSHGLKGTYELLGDAYSKIHMIVKPDKQVEICYKGYPLVDFLQHPYIQGEDASEHQNEYKKFMRQVTSGPYQERNSRLYPVVQWVINLGKYEAAVCEENMDLAVSILSDAGIYYNQLALEKKYKPAVNSGLSRSKDPLVFNEAYTPMKSTFLGLEQLLGLVKSYGQELVAQLGRYAAGKLAKVLNEFERELETRAPHREGMAKVFFKAMGDEYYAKAGGDERFGGIGAPTHFYFIEALEKLIDLRGKDVSAVVLDQPQIRTADSANDSLVDESDNADYYEF